MDVPHARLALPLEDGDLRLADGRRITFGPLGPADRRLIQAAMLRLSPESSRRRFFTVRRQLSDAELDVLTAPPSPERVVIGVKARYPDGRVEGVGIGRFVGVAERPDAAETALTVIDDYQHRGIGRVLLQRLAREAFLRGYRRLTGLVVPENIPLFALLQRLAPRAVRRFDGEHVAIEIPLPVLG